MDLAQKTQKMKLGSGCRIVGIRRPKSSRAHETGSVSISEAPGVCLVSEYIRTLTHDMKVRNPTIEGRLNIQYLLHSNIE